MKGAVVAFGAILLFCSFILPAATAAGITLVAGQQDYYFPAGRPVEIPLTVTSTFPGDVAGTVRFSTDAELQKTGTVMISTENRVFTRTVPAGSSFLNLTMAPSQVSRDYRVRVSLYYRDPSPVNASLPEFFVHAVTDPGLVKNTPAQLVSTSRPESNEIPSASSVSIVEQTVGIREQMGSDSSRGQSLVSGRPEPGSKTAEEQQRDRDRREREQKEFDALLAQDPLVMAVNRSLSAEEFSRQAPDTQPAGNDTGTFSMLYRRGAEDRVVVYGSMVDGIVPSVRELANVPITADPSLDANTTFRSFAWTLEGLEFGHKETVVNRTISGAVVNITYATAAGRKAYVNATTEGNRVLQLDLAQEPESAGFPRFMSLVVAILILTVTGWYVYRKFQKQKLAVPDTGTVMLPSSFDHRAEADRILSEAEQAFTRQEYALAYGLAGRALRVFLSHEYGDRGEVTVTEIIAVLHSAGHDTASIESVLGQCSDVAFARGVPEAGDFSRITGRIREIFET